MENIEKIQVSEEGNSCTNVVDQTLLQQDDSITPRKRSWMFQEKKNSEKENDDFLLQQYSLEDGELTPTILAVSDSSHSGIVEDKKRRSKKLCYSSFIETSKEEGECSTSFTDSDNDLEATVIENHVKIPVSNDKIIKNNDCVVENSSEAGCTQACADIDDSITDSIKESISKSDTNVSSIVMDKVLLCTHDTGSIEYKMHLEGNEPGKKLSQKRKLTSENYYESTPKRRHLFIPEDSESNLLSPIVKVKSGILSDEKPSDVETPVMQSKYQGSCTNICSTPLSKSENFIALKSSLPCSDSQPSYKNENHNINSTNLLSKPVDDSSLGPNNVSDVMTVDELIADITQLCDSFYSTLDSVEEDNACNVSSMSEVAVNVADHQVNVSVVSSTFVEDEKEEDTTITELADPVIKHEDRMDEVGPGNFKSPLDESVDLETSSGEKDKVDELIIESERTAGRFKDINFVSKIDIGVDKDETDASKDIDVSNTSFEDCVGDILCLENQYDDVDAGYVDETLLEKSHFVANLDKSVMKDCLNESAIKSLKDDFITEVQVEEKAKDIEPPLKVDIDTSEKVKNQSSKDDFMGKIETTVFSAVSKTKDHVCEGFDFSNFDADKYRKSAELLVEKEACRRWGTTNVGTPNFDVNLTTSTTFHKKMSAAGDNTGSGYLECDSLVCTYLCEDKINCKLNRYSCTNSDSAYMRPEFILHRLENQKQLLGEMRHMSLFQLKGGIESRKSAMRQHHIAEFNGLLQRHRIQVDDFMYQTSNILNSGQIQEDLRQMHQKHRADMAHLKQRHHNEFSSLCAHGRETLNRLVTDYDTKVYPLDGIIEQLSNVQCHTGGLSYEYGPPVVVNLSKRPCRDTNWEHSTVRTFLPAGIGQAVTLEEDLYDHYYSHD